MPQFNWWQWSDPEDQQKNDAQTFLEQAQRAVQQNDLSQVQTHAGNLIENFKGDIADRMMRWSAPASAPTAAPPPAPTSALVPQPSPVSTAPQGSGVMDTLSGAANAVSGGLHAVIDPLLELSGTADVYRERKRMMDLGRMAAAEGTYPNSPEFAQTHPAEAQEAEDLNTQAVAGSVVGAEGGVKVAGTAAAKGAGEIIADIARRASGMTVRESVGNAAAAVGKAFDARIPGLGPSANVVLGEAEQKVAQSWGARNARPSAVPSRAGLTQQLLDDLDPVNQLMKDLEKKVGRPLEDNENAYEILRLGRASNEIGDQWYRTHVEQTLGELAGTPQGRVDLSNYLRARDAIDKAAEFGTPGTDGFIKGNKDRLFGGMTAKDAEAALTEMQTRMDAAVPGSYAQLEAGAAKFHDLGNFLLDRKVRAGLVSQELADMLKQRYPHYMPIQTVDWLNDKLSETATRVGRAGGATRDLKELTELGTQRVAEDPLEAYYRASQRTAALSAKNEAGLALINAMKETPGFSGLMRPANEAAAQLVPRDGGFARLPGETLFPVRHNGQVLQFHINKSLEPMLNFSTSQGDSIFEKLFTPLANVTRKAAIGYNPLWGVRQIAMDSLAFLIKEGGFLPSYTGKGLEWRTGESAKQLYGAAKAAGREYANELGFNVAKSPLYAEAKAAGALPGAVEHVSGKPGSYRSIVKAMSAGDLKDVSSAADFVGWLGRTISGFNETLDAVPRLAEYQARRGEGASMQKAAIAARDVTLDPSRGGTLIRQANAVIPFFNVAFQSTAYLPRLLKNPDPAVRWRAASGIVSSVMIPSMLLEYYNQQDPRYADVPDYDKDRGFILMDPNRTGKIDPVTGQEKPEYYMIRTGPFTPFVIAARYMANAAFNAEGADLGKTVTGLARSTMPVDLTDPVSAAMSGGNPWEGAGRAAMSMFPAGAKQIAEINANYDSFRDRAIVPEGLQHLPPEQQYTENTSETAKQLGALIGASPAKIDYLLQSWGGASSAIVGASDAVLGVTGIAAKGDSARVAKLKQQLAMTGLDDDKRLTLQKELEREVAIKEDRDSSLKNTPIIGGLFGAYYREQGGQTLIDRAKDLDQALLDKKRDTSPVAKELERLGVGFADVDSQQIRGVSLTRAQSVQYREDALAYRERLLSDLTQQDFYKHADDKEKKRLAQDALQRGAGWAAAKILPERIGAGEGGEFVTDKVNGNLDVASRGYISALRAQGELNDKREHERFVNVTPEQYAQVSRDIGQLQQMKQVAGDSQGEMLFASQFGYSRLAAAKNARQSKYWGDTLDRFYQSNPEYVLYIGAGPQTITRRGLDATTVAQLAGL